MFGSENVSESPPPPSPPAEQLFSELARCRCKAHGNILTFCFPPPPPPKQTPWRRPWLRGLRGTYGFFCVCVCVCVAGGTQFYTNILAIHFSSEWLGAPTLMHNVEGWWIPPIPSHNRNFVDIMGTSVVAQEAGAGAQLKGKGAGRREIIGCL